VSERGVAIAEELLPTTSGFFFGGTQYDDWYLEGLRYTKDILYKVLTDLIPNKGWKFEYSSSW
jgi:hypothetical protein